MVRLNLPTLNSKDAGEAARQQGNGDDRRQCCGHLEQGGQDPIPSLLACLAHQQGGTRANSHQGDRKSSRLGEGHGGRQQQQQRSCHRHEQAGADETTQQQTPVLLPAT